MQAGQLLLLAVAAHSCLTGWLWHVLRLPHKRQALTGQLPRQALRLLDLPDPAGQPRAIVVDVGGFMGVGARRVAVSWPSVHVPPPGAADKHVAIDLTDAQVRAAPDYTDRSKPAVIVGLPAAPDPAASDTPNDTPKQPDAPK